MVYININDTAPAVYLPLNGQPFSIGTAALSVRNTTDGRVLDMPIASASVRGFLVLLVLTLPAGFSAGEWEYRFTGNAGAVVIASGLVAAHDGQREAPVQYESENNVIQYGG